MKRIRYIAVILSIVLISQNLMSQELTDYKVFSGSWLGKIPAGGATLRIIFNLTLAGKDSLTATLDSPDQGVKNIKIGPVLLKGKEINIKAPLLLGEYKGLMKNDTIIDGIWTQRGAGTPLTLAKLKKAFSLNRPQEPKPPFSYRSEDIIFRNEAAGIDLGGTLTIPGGEGPFPAVILITGSGSQNRNEEIMGHKPFWVIADYLSRNGIAVLRYDDRGVGQSKGTPVNATSADFSTDAEAAFLYLSARKEIKHDRIGLVGHSEGGLIAPIVASRNKNIAFIISLAGPGVNGEEIINTQNLDINTAAGGNQKEILKSIAVNKKIFEVLKKENDNKAAAQKVTEVYTKILVKEKKSQEDIDKAVKQMNNSLNPASYTWIRYFLITEPSVYWKKIRVPVLALNGEKDLQVAAKVNLAAIEKALRSGKNQDVKTIALPGLNHLFQHCSTGLPAEYGEIEETFSPEVLKLMGDWIISLN
jgi:uncharacterized protein